MFPFTYWNTFYYKNKLYKHIASPKHKHLQIADIVAE